MNPEHDEQAARLEYEHGGDRDDDTDERGRDRDPTRIADEHAEDLSVGRAGRSSDPDRSTACVDRVGEGGGRATDRGEAREDDDRAEQHLHVPEDVLDGLPDGRPGGVAPTGRDDRQDTVVAADAVGRGRKRGVRPRLRRN